LESNFEEKQISRKGAKAAKEHSAQEPFLCPFATLREYAFGLPATRRGHAIRERVG
jgi:hypothetical protein